MCDANNSNNNNNKNPITFYIYYICLHKQYNHVVEVLCAWRAVQFCPVVVLAGVAGGAIAALGLGNCRQPLVRLVRRFLAVSGCLTSHHHTPGGGGGGARLASRATTFALALTLEAYQVALVGVRLAAMSALRVARDAVVALLARRRHRYLQVARVLAQYTLLRLLLVLVDAILYWAAIGRRRRQHPDDVRLLMLLLESLLRVSATCTFNRFTKHLPVCLYFQWEWGDGVRRHLISVLLLYLIAKILSSSYNISKNKVCVRKYSIFCAY